MAVAAFQTGDPVTGAVDPEISDQFYDDPKSSCPLPTPPRSGRGFAAGSTSAGSLGVIGHDPEIELTAGAGSEVTVHLGVPEDADATIEGDAVQLLEAVSLQAPGLPIAEEHRWLLAEEHRWLLAEEHRWLPRRAPGSPRPRDRRAV